MPACLAAMHIQLSCFSPRCLLLTPMLSCTAARPRPLVALARPASVAALQAQDSLRRASSASLPQAADDGSSDDEGNIVYAEWHSRVSIMFTDIVGFTDMANQAHPHQVGADGLLGWGQTPDRLCSAD